MQKLNSTYYRLKDNIILAWPSDSRVWQGIQIQVTGPGSPAEIRFDQYITIQKSLKFPSPSAINHYQIQFFIHNLERRPSCIYQNEYDEAVEILDQKMLKRHGV